jgi:hypothetical protein
MNVFKTIEMMDMKRELGKFIDSADLDVIVRMEHAMTGRHREQETVQEDLGSEVIEKLLDAVEHADYESLKAIHAALKFEGLMK